MNMAREGLGYAEALEHNAGRLRSPEAKLSHIEVTHHMTDGSALLERVEPGKMAEHLADCPHCGVEASGSTTAAD
jgi:hypothetical protein